jgi:hypothetical protein
MHWKHGCVPQNSIRCLAPRTKLGPNKNRPHSRRMQRTSLAGCPGLSPRRHSRWRDCGQPMMGPQILSLPRFVCICLVWKVDRPRDFGHSNTDIIRVSSMTKLQKSSSAAKNLFMSRTGGALNGAHTHAHTTISPKPEKQKVARYSAIGGPVRGLTIGCKPETQTNAWLRSPPLFHTTYDERLMSERSESSFCRCAHKDILFNPFRGTFVAGARYRTKGADSIAAHQKTMGGGCSPRRRIKHG